MIDPQTETLIPLKQVSDFLPSRVRGKRLQPSTLYRWILRSRNPLEVVKIGGGTFTSVEALARFMECRNPPGPAPEPSPSRRARMAGAALRKLIGGDGKAA
jgi:hypothetical protein